MNLRLRIYGIPAAQGSKRHVGGGRMVEMSKRIKPWREAVYAAILHDYPTLIEMDGPVSVRATFLFDRPKSHYGTRLGEPYLKDGAPMYVTRTPDLDKVVRATLDPLTEMGVWKDDSQVAILHAAKRYCLADERPGAILLITNSLVETRDE